MFTLIKKIFNKKIKHSNDQADRLIEPFDKSLKSMSKALAIAEVSQEYFDKVEKGEIVYPAYTRKESNVMSIWTDTRIEVLSFLYQHGASDGIILADAAEQNNIIEAYFNVKPHLEYPYVPTGEVIHDTIQAVHNIYFAIKKIGKKAGDINSIYFKNSKEKTEFSDFELIMNKANNYWNSIIDSDINNKGDVTKPILIFDLLFEDITMKTKTIALSAIFGSDYKKAMNNLINKFEMSQQEKLEIQKKFEQILNTSDPDYWVE